MICSRTHLVEQIKLFPNAIVLLAGGKAAQVGSLLTSLSHVALLLLLDAIKKKENKQKAVAEECKAHVEIMMGRIA